MHKEVRSEFQVKILGLAVGHSRHGFQVDDAFFASYEHSLVKRGRLTAVVELHKSETLIRAHFAIEGTIELESDRSLEPFDFPVSIREELLYKFGDEDREISEEMQQIAWETYALDLAQPIYEFIMLAVPMRKLKPGEDEEPDGTVADEERRLVYRSAPAEEESDEREPDPQWDALRKLFPN